MSFIQGTVEYFIKHIGSFADGFWSTIILSAVVVLAGTIVGAGLAFLKDVKFKPLQWLLSFYIELIRGTPIMLQLYMFYYIPLTIGIKIDKVFAISLALVVNSSAYVAEIFRAGIQAVDSGQSEAARSLGLSEKNVMLRVVFPQAIKNILPALGNEFIMMIKETSLASVFFIPNLMTSYSILRSATYKTIEPLIILACTYFVITYTLSLGVKWMERKLGVNDK